MKRGVYQYYDEYVRDFPLATFQDWMNYRCTHWEEFDWTEWYDDLFTDLAVELKENRT